MGGIIQFRATLWVVGYAAMGARVYYLGMLESVVNSQASMCILMVINPGDHSPARCFISGPDRSVKGHPSACNQPFCPSVGGLPSSPPEKLPTRSRELFRILRLVLRSQCRCPQDYLSRGISVVVPRSSFDVQSQRSKYEKGLSDLFGAQVTIQNVGIYNDTTPNS